jgi:hypothetical protein
LYGIQHIRNKLVSTHLIPPSGGFSLPIFNPF